MVRTVLSVGGPVTGRVRKLISGCYVVQSAIGTLKYSTVLTTSVHGTN